MATNPLSVPDKRLLNRQVVVWLVRCSKVRRKLLKFVWSKGVRNIFNRRNGKYDAVVCDERLPIGSCPFKESVKHGALLNLVIHQFMRFFHRHHLPGTIVP